MKKLGLLILIVVLMALLLPAVSMAGDPEKITICHYPPGNPGNVQYIEISENAWPAHAAHGDDLAVWGEGWECVEDGVG
jgi:hypothetical protein